MDASIRMTAAAETKEQFEARLRAALENIGTDTLACNEEEARSFAPLYSYLEQYIHGRQLYNAAIALPLVRSYLLQAPGKAVGYREEGKARFDSYRHALSIGRMLIELKPELSREEEDLVLAAALAHVLNNMVAFDDPGAMIVAGFGIDPRVYRIIATNAKPGRLSELERKRFYQRIEKDKLTLLVKLADRGNLLEQLHGLDSMQAQDRIFETRQYFLPMCIYAREHYPELDSAVTILMEKMKYLIEVADILSVRYRERETALANEILTLKEENARIRAMIASLERERT